MSKGFRKDKSTADFSMSTVTDGRVIDIDITRIDIRKSDAAMLFNELKSVYNRLNNVLGDTVVMMEFDRCLQYYYKTILEP